MRFVLAPDKFKGSLTGLQFCHVVEESLKKVLPQAEVVKLPLADGGDGTIEILEYHLKGKRIHLKVNDPLFRPIETSYLLMDAVKTAFIEMAGASGMALLKPEERNCVHTTTLGTGEMIADAAKRGAQTIILGIGGSATNDCGMGMATALGYRFEDAQGNVLSPIGKHLALIKTIRTGQVIPELKHVTVKVACDVTNPLYGPQGAAYVYGPQKGASADEVKQLDIGLKLMAGLLLDVFGKEVQYIKGAGAAGGMGAGAVTFLDAELISGIDLIKELIDFDAKVAHSDWIITGEGQLDSQTLSGKTIQGVLTSAMKYGVSVAALCGSISLTEKESQNMGISYTDSVIENAKDFNDAMQNSRSHLSVMATRFAQTLR